MQSVPSYINLVRVLGKMIQHSIGFQAAGEMRDDDTSSSSLILPVLARYL